MALGEFKLCFFSEGSGVNFLNHNNKTFVKTTKNNNDEIPLHADIVCCKSRRLSGKRVSKGAGTPCGA